MSMHQADPASRTESRKVGGRPRNAEMRQREYLTAAEIDHLIKAARSGRHGHRDATLILIAYRHGLHGKELADLEWSQVEFNARDAVLHVKRIKGSRASVHTLKGDEVRALRQLHREAKGPHVFETERGGPFTRDALNKQLKNIAERAGFAKNAVHFHMLRHGCGYALANKGHDTRAIQHWMGHANIQHTVRYTELSPTRFKDFWR